MYVCMRIQACVHDAKKAKAADRRVEPLAITLHMQSSTLHVRVSMRQQIPGAWLVQTHVGECVAPTIRQSET